MRGLERIPQSSLESSDAETNGEQESREKEFIITEAFEYVDAEGKSLGNAEAVYGTETLILGNDDKGRPITGKDLFSFVLRGVKDGKPSETDVLELINPRDVRVIVSDAGHLSDTYSYHEEQTTALVPKLDTLSGIAVMLHELGHAEQHGEVRFQTVEPHYERGLAKNDVLRATLRELSQLRDLLPKQFPELAQELDLPELRGIEELKSSIEQAHDEVERLEGESHALRAELQSETDPQLFRALERQAPFVDSFVAFEERYGKEGITGVVDALEGMGISIARGTGIVETEKKNVLSGTLDELSLEDTALGAVPALSENDIRSISDASTVLHSLRNLFTTRRAYAKTEGASGEAVIAMDLNVAMGAHPKRAVSLRLSLSAEERSAIVQAEDAMRPRFEENQRLLKEAIATLEGLDKEVSAITDSSLAREILRTPKRLMERDATTRAFKWARKLRQETGVDLFAQYAVAPELDLRVRHSEGTAGNAGAGVDDENCQEDMIKVAHDPSERSLGPTDIIEQLRTGLQSHRDDRPSKRVLRDAREP